jgi:tRNA A-37 threonylcarbamoyl transferase component Bud32
MNYRYPPDSKPLPGYTIKQGVGRGAFGEVYYAVSDGGKEVALKLVQYQVEVELRGVRECLNLDHPNLVRLYDVQKTDAGESWVVMEYCGGESLEEAIARYPHGMPIDEALRWMRGICEGVGYLHSKDIVHRDLKPSHCYMEDGVVKIGDYGLAKFVTVSKRSGNTEGVGTVFYAAPEMAHGKYGKEIDLYAIGVMFYEMLSGDVPFDGQSAAEVLMKHLTATPDVQRFPAPYCDILERLLEKDPKHRFRSIDELTEALNAPLSLCGPRNAVCVGRRIVQRIIDPLELKRRARRTARLAWNHKGATVGLFILTAIALGLGIAIGDANRNNWNRLYPAAYVRPRRLVTSRLGQTPIKRNDNSGTTVQLGQIASFRQADFRGVDNGRRRGTYYRMAHVRLQEGRANDAGVTQKEVLEGLWDDGYCPAIDIRIHAHQAARHKVDINDIVDALGRIAQGNNARQKQVEIWQSRNRVLVRFARLRGNNEPQGSVAFYLMDPMAFLKAKVPTKDGKSGAVGLSEIADIHIAAGDPVFK